jgi:crotonobetainyl-CoA:carnitine CoA-transferase CaiB-like acyl-CoA transferase
MVADAKSSATQAQSKVLGGIRVLDFGRFIAGPCAAAILGDLGAEVIRVDKRGGSEDRAMIPVTEQGEGAMFLQNNRNKRSITLNPAREGGAELVRRLVAQSDIVVANLPFSTVKTMKLDIESLREVRPDVILLMSSAYGSGGPYSDRVGFDGVGQVMSGAVYRSGTPEQPVRTMVPYVDYATALSGVAGVLAALRHRDMTGEGQLVETSLLASALMIASGFLIEQGVLACDRRAMLNRAQLAAPVDMFKVTDGWIFVQAVGDAIYARWARLMGEEQPWLTEPRFATDALRGENGEEISARMAQWCQSRSRSQALAELDRVRIPAYPIYSPQEALDDPHVQAMGYFKMIDYPGLPRPAPVVETPFRMSRTPPEYRSAPPTLGAHTQEVLLELGYDDAQIGALKAAGTI